MDRRIEKSKKALRAAFWQLREKKSIQDIKISELCQAADVNKTTFYAHYPDIYGIVDEIQEEIIRKNMDLFRQIEFRNILRDPKPYLQCITATMEGNLALMRRLGLTDADKGRVIMVGNNLSRDVVGANRYGIGSVHFCWSPRYPHEASTPEEEPTYRIHTMPELLPLAERLESTL